MVLDAMIDGDSLTIDIADPFHPDLVALVSRIGQFFHSKGADISGLDVSELILRIIKGIAGCEKGCPADANGIVSRGFKVLSCSIEKEASCQHMPCSAMTAIFISRYFLTSDDL